MQTEQRYYSPEEYLALEEVADYKSEYIDGQIIPMTGGTTNHNQIAGNFYIELGLAFKKLDYRVFIGDVRLWIPERRIYTYPDIMIVAGEPEYYNNRQDTITNPTVIIEVLSKSTQAYDRSKKFKAYRTIPTFEEYLLVAQNQVYVEQFHQTISEQWSFNSYDEKEEAIALKSLPFQITLADIYHKVTLEPESDEIPTDTP